MHQENLHDILSSRWQETIKHLPFNQIAANQIFNDIITAYSTPDRYYHTCKHLLHILITIDNLKTYVKDRQSVEFAAWFHDIIYDTQAKDNEEKSAEYAGELLPILGITNNNIDQIKHLILNTKHHQAATDDVDSQVLLDADLAILAADPIQYQEYATAIRQEYAWVPEAEYIVGRQQVLERFLQRDRIYFTPLMYTTAEQPARRNLQGEVEYLQGKGDKAEK
ncbi:hypothetical protein H6G33_07030 [Calothrix sp. FACHB-1219]|uniref:HD domain-containing protein n=1 Tax=unclassified Calothrix TaxID=2619626 RepID=UPI001689026D|nr:MULTISPECIES: hypothetical protein [unclassified Calothrix]MBD2204707.1 hypothetical protein [Calothrix sp. FACHB-168]MBD2216781.1 hypothetical protein [Calothrix sp. FACHB-1219]